MKFSIFYLPKKLIFSAILTSAAFFLSCSPSSPSDGPRPPSSCTPNVQCGDAECGDVSDGCGGTASCGTCQQKELACIQGRCVPCTPTRTCDSEGWECGVLIDDCGRKNDCGSCDEPQACSEDGHCFDCTRLTCDDMDDTCGEIIADGCGGAISCGCPIPGTRCDDSSCILCPDYSCEDFGAECGTVDDGCGRDPLYCGTCSGELNCVNNRCTACVPSTAEERCAALALNCGDINDGCGGTLNCGFCNAPESCTANKCVCTPLTCEEQGITCGEAYDGCGHYISCGPACTNGETSVIRLLTGNITSGDAQSYTAGHGIRIFQGLKPQIALIQEFNYGNSTAKDIRTMVETAFGSRFFHVLQSKISNTSIPNGIVSYYPIKSWGLLEDDNVGGTRHHVWARIDIPGPKDLWVISVHMSTQYTKRLKSMSDLLDDIETLGIPASDFLAIGGDFNTKKFADTTLETLASTGRIVLDTSEAEDYPIDQSGNGATSSNRTNPLDGIYTSQNLKNLRTPVVIGKAKNLTLRGLVFDSREFKPLSEVSPILESDSAAKNMQHMAVVKDYAIQR